MTCNLDHFDIPNGFLGQFLVLKYYVFIVFRTLFSLLLSIHWYWPTPSLSYSGRSTQNLCPMMMLVYLSKIDPNTEIIRESRAEKLLCGQKWTCAKKWQNSTNYNHSSSHHTTLWAKISCKSGKSSLSLFLCTRSLKNL